MNMLRYSLQHTDLSNLTIDESTWLNEHIKWHCIPILNSNGNRYIEYDREYNDFPNSSEFILSEEPIFSIATEYLILFETFDPTYHSNKDNIEIKHYPLFINAIDKLTHTYAKYSENIDKTINELHYARGWIEQFMPYLFIPKVKILLQWKTLFQWAMNNNIQFICQRY